MAELTGGSPSGPATRGVMWTLGYTSHLGYAPPTLRPQFLETVGSTDPVEHIAYAAELGMTGVLYPWAVQMDADEVNRVARAMRAAGLRASTTVCMPLTAITQGLWTSPDPAAREVLEQYVREASARAETLGSDNLAVIIAGDDAPGGRQVAVENLRAMADIAEAHGARLGLEPIMAMPNPLLRSMAETVGLLADVADPRVGLIFDTAHVVSMHDDLLSSLDAAYEHLHLVQVVDLPGRIEPGAGELPLVEFAAELIRRGYTGLVDLEHGWLDPGADGEAAGFERIRHFDAAVRASLA